MSLPKCTIEVIPSLIAPRISSSKSVGALYVAQKSVRAIEAVVDAKARSLKRPLDTRPTI